MRCTHCGSSNVDTDHARGDTACMDCGAVLRGNLLVTEMEFEETSGGRARAVGQFVHEGETAWTSMGGIHGKSRASREMTLYNAKKHITAMGTILRMPQLLIDMASNFYRMAYEHRLTRGHKLAHTVASCLYISARLEGTPHMLLDFCDVARANVVVVCKCYMKIVSALCITLPPTDPSIYIPRFAEKLSFGDKTHNVSMIAMRLVQRMKRDWMVTGRRLSGLCGAALLFAARICGFNRTIEDVAPVVKISKSTIRTRMIEFEETCAASMTVEEFQRRLKEADGNDKDDDLPEGNPPAFDRNRSLDVIMEEELSKLVESDAFETELATMQNNIEAEIERIRNISQAKMDPSDLIQQAEDLLCFENAKASSQKKRPNDDDDTDLTEFLVEMHTQMIEEFAIDDVKQFSGNKWKQTLEKSLSDLKKETVDPTVSVGANSTTKPVVDQASNDRDEEELSDIEDAEIDEYIMSKDEVNIKTRMWLKANVDWLRDQKRKELQRKEDAEEQECDPHFKPKKRNKRRKLSPQKEFNSVSDALGSVIKQYGLSKKVNYDILKQIDQDFAEFETSKMTERTTGNTNDDPTTVEASCVEGAFSKPIEGSFKTHLSLDTLPTKQIGQTGIVEESDRLDISTGSRKRPVCSKEDKMPSPIANVVDEDEDEDEDDDDDEEDELGHLRGYRGENEDYW